MKNKNIKLGLVSSSSLLLIATGSANSKSYAEENFEKNNENKFIKKIEGNLKTVINLDFSKDFNEELEFLAIPENNEIIISSHILGKDFSVPNIPKNDPLVEKLYSREIDGKTKIIIKTKQSLSFDYLKNKQFVTILLEESENFKNKKTGEIFKFKVDTNNITNSWVKINNFNQDKSHFLELEKINIKKENQQENKLEMKFNNNIVDPIVKKEKDKLIVTFKNTDIDEKLINKINKIKVGSLIKNIKANKEEGDLSLILNNEGIWDYKLINLGKKIILEIKEKEDSTENVKYSGKKLSMSFQDMEVRAILQVIADFTGLNIISSDAVIGTMSIRLKDVPWDQALDIILESRGLQKVKEGSVIWVATKEEVERNNATKISLINQNLELEPLKLEFFQINYYKAEELKSVLEANNKNNVNSNNSNISILSKRGSIGVDARNNILFIQDTEERLKEIKKIIKKLDIANKQVLVEAKIVIADKKFGQDIGAKFGINYTNTNGNGQLNTKGVANSSGVLSNLAAGTVNGANPGAIGITLLNTATQNLINLELSAIEDNNRGKIISNPRLLTADNKKATIKQGSQIPYVRETENGGSPKVDFKEAVLELNVMPQIAPNGKVVLDLKISKDSIGQLIPVAGGGTIPTIDTKQIETTVTVNNGQTVVLGGVYEIQNQEDIQKIPFLADLPMLGNLFQRNVKNEIKGELMVFITPFIIDNKDLDSEEKEMSNEIVIEK